MKKKKQIPWNKGLKGEAAGWTEERRQEYRDRQIAWLKANPTKGFQPGKRPGLWKTGKNPRVRKLYYRFLKARNQAKFWKQPWNITWPQYFKLDKKCKGNWSRANNHKNLCRIDTSKGWTLKNVQFMTRQRAMERETTNRRVRPAGLGKGRHWWRKKDDSSG